jgi:hypothetical protein
MSTPSNSIVRDAASTGGGRSSSASNTLDSTVGEEAVFAPGSVTSSNRLASGYNEIYAFPGAVVNLAAGVAVSTGYVNLTWSAPGYDGFLGSLLTGSSYRIAWSSATNPVWNSAAAQIVVSTSGVSPGAAQSLTATGLLPNTTTYFELWTLDADGNESGLSNVSTTTTLAAALVFAPSPFPMIAQSSVSATWGALPVSPASATAEGFILQASTASNFSGTLYSSSTYGVAATTLTVIGLTQATTYYFRAGTLNWLGSVNYVAFSSAVTGVPPPTSYPVYSAPQVSTNAATGPWTAVTNWVSSTTVDARVSVQNTIAGMLVSTTQPAGLFTQWHMDESAGAYVLDASGNSDTGTLVGSPTWVPGHSGLALSLDGSSQYFYGAASQNNPSVFTVELWFKTTTTTGGRLIGFGSNQTGSSGNYDRHIYMSNSGQLYFGVYPGSVQTLNTSSSYNDGNWHHVAATLSGAGQFLYVDGSLAASNASVTSAQSYTGWWRVGDDNLSGWTSQPSSFYFNGLVDEARVYTTALSAAQIAVDAGADTLAAQNQGDAFSVLFSSNAGASWSYLSPSSVTMTGVNGTTAVQTFEANGLPLAISTNANSTENLIEFVSASLAGSVLETQYAIRVDTTPPPPPTFASLTNAATGGLTLNGLSGSDALSGLSTNPFDVQASTDPAFGIVNADSGWIAGPTQAFTTLNPNNTYYVRAEAQDAAGNVSTFSAVKNLATLASAPTGLSLLGFSASSATASWNALAVSPSSASSEGYELDASSTNFGALLPGGVVSSSVTPSVQASTLSVFGLAANTTYYFRVSALNWSGATDYVGISSYSSLANLVVSPATSAVYASSVTVAWGLPTLGNEGFVLQASTSPSFSGLITSSSNANGSATSLTVAGLFSATTYYFRVASLNWNSVPNYALAGSTLTPTSVISSMPSTVTDLAASTNTATSAFLTWSAPFDPADSPLTGEYAIQYATYSYVALSTTAAQVLISTTGVVAGSAQSAVIPGLAPNTTYFFWLWTANYKPNWSAVSDGATVATLAAGVSSSQVLSISTFSTSVGWAAFPASPASFSAEGYELDASSTNFGALVPGGVVYSSVTTAIAASTLTLAGLDPNTTYYYRVGSLNWAGALDYVSAGSSSTLAVAPTAVSPPFLGIYPSSLTVNWAALPATPSSAASEGYELDASSTNFGALTPGGVILSSITFVNSASTLTVLGLNSNTTYYFRVGALNWSGAPDYTVLSATSTNAQAPGTATPPYLTATLTDLAAQWTAGANNPPLSYRLDLSTAPDFSGAIFSSSTLNAFADVTGLTLDTVYYGRITAFGNSGIASPYLFIGSSATLASQPLTTSPTFSGVGLSGLTVSYANGSPPNPTGALYLVEVSQSPSFASFVSSETANLSATFSGLQGGVVYYAQVAAVNPEGVASAFTSLGSTVTLSSLPVYSAPEASTNAATGPWNSIPGWISSSTANVQTTVVSSVSGLLVSTTQPSGLITQWHLDESLGSAALDASGNGDTGTVVGAAPWVAGHTGLAMNFNGSTQNIYSATSFNNPNSFTLEVWFKTTTNSGGKLIGLGMSQTGLSGGYDRQIYMSNSGQLYFGVYPNSVVTLNTTASYNDGNWHHAAAALSTAGMYFYVDGVLAGSNPSVTTGQNYIGYWRVGGDNCTAWTNAPTSNYFNGTIDEVRIYNVALTTAQVVADYSADSLGAQNQGQAFSVLFSSNAGLNWSYASISSTTLTGSNGTIAPQVFETNKLPLAVSTSATGSLNQVEFVAQALSGSVTEVEYNIQVDTVAPATPSFSPLSSPTTYGVTIGGLSASDALSGLSAAPFDVQASTDPAFGGIGLDTGWISGPGVVLAGLNANTTYYARVSAQDAAGNVSAYSAVSSPLATLAIAPAAPGFSAVTFTTASYSWSRRAVLPSSTSAEGYELDGSTAPDFSGTVISSFSTSATVSTLSITGLDLTTTEYFRVAALNWAGAANYSATSVLDLALSVSTTALHFGAIDPSVARSSVSVSSIVVTNVGNIPETVTLWGADVTPSGPWTLSTSSGVEQAVVQGLWNSVQPSSTSFSAAITASTTTSGGAGGNYAGDQNGMAVPVGATRVMWFQLFIPTSSAGALTQELRVDMRPVYP